MLKKKTIPGHKYIYKILTSRFRNHYYFAVRAVDNKTKRTSFINTINPLLGELGINSNDRRFWESEWLVTKNELKTFSSKINRILTDKEYLSYFESYLDKDRIEGEWENSYE